MERLKRIEKAAFDLAQHLNMTYSKVGVPSPTVLLLERLNKALNREEGNGGNDKLALGNAGGGDGNSGVA